MQRPIIHLACALFLISTLSALASPPVITRNPVSRGVRGNTNLTLRVEATGTEPLNFQWQFNGTNLVNETASSLTITNFRIGNVGSYRALISNAEGTNATFPAILTLSGDLLRFAPDRPPEWVGTNISSFTAQGESYFAMFQDDGTFFDTYDYIGNWWHITNCPGGASFSSVQNHTLILKEDGTISAHGWGYYDGGNPVTIPPGLSNVVAAQANGYRDWALLNDGTVVSWNHDGFEPPSGISNVISISHASWTDTTCFLKEDGTVLSPFHPLPPGLTNIASLSGESHFVGLKRDGTVIAWENDHYLTNLPTDLNDIVSVESGSGLLDAAIRSDGSVKVWCSENCNYIYLTSPMPFPSWLTGVTSVEARNGYYVTSDIFVLTPAPYIVAPPRSRKITLGTNVTFSVEALNPISVKYQWKFESMDLPGETNSSLTITNAQSSHLGKYTVILSNPNGAESSATATLRLKSLQPSGAAVSWWDSEGREPNVKILATNAISIIRGYSQTPYILHDDGTVTENGLRIPGMSNVIQIASSYDWLLAVRDDGSLTSRGSWPGFVYGMHYLSDIKKVTLTILDTHALALSDDGIVTAWGNNYYYGQATVPPEATNVVDIWAVDGASYALRENGTMVEWGVNWNLGSLPIELRTNVISMSFSREHASVVTRAGTVEEWGYVMPRPNISNIVDVAAGRYAFSLALDREGKVTAWGDSYGGGSSNIPSCLTGVTAIAADYQAYAITTNPFVGFSQVPSDQLALLGQDVVFDGAVTASGPFTYQWKYNGVDIPGATQTILTIPNAQFYKSGTYTLTASVLGMEPFSYPLKLVAGDQVITWNRHLVPPFPLTNAVDVAAGNAFNVALLADGTVLSYGHQCFSSPGKFKRCFESVMWLWALLGTSQ